MRRLLAATLAAPLLALPAAAPAGGFYYHHGYGVEFGGFVDLHHGYPLFVRPDLFFVPLHRRGGAWYLPHHRHHYRDRVGPPPQSAIVENDPPRALPPPAPLPAEPPGPPTLVGPEWQVFSIGGVALLPRTRVSLEVTGRGESYGNSGCNAWRGQVTVDGPQLGFGPRATTRKACVPGLMDQEQRFHTALDAVSRWKIENETLMLSDPDGTVLLQLRRGAD